MSLNKTTKTNKQTKIPKLPKGSRPIGPLPPQTNTNVLIFPGNNIRVDPDAPFNTQVIFVDFFSKRKIGHVS